MLSYIAANENVEMCMGWLCSVNKPVLVQAHNSFSLNILILVVHIIDSSIKARLISQSIVVETIVLLDRMTLIIDIPGY